MKYLQALRMLGRCGAVALSVTIGSCANSPFQPIDTADIDGRIFDVKTGTSISRVDLVNRAIAARFLVLGETHDNPTHHRLQTEMLATLVAAGRRPALAMEQFDRSHQSVLDRALAGKAIDAETLADAGGFDRRGWDWQAYKPLVEIAAANRLRILAANFSREEARALMQTGKPAAGLPALSEKTLAALESNIVEGHCGHRPSPLVLSGMVEAQRARDAQMAKSLLEAGSTGAVLIAGLEHARRDRGAIAYLPSKLAEDVLSVGFVESDPQSDAAPGRYAGRFDVVWFTNRAERDDPCKGFRLPARK